MKRGTPRHPKVGDLMEALGIKSRAEACGHLELLWHFTAEFAPQGDIGKYSPARIEAACDWYGKPGRLVEAFTTSGWVEVADATTHQWVGMESNTTKRVVLVVHDWHDHCEDSVRKKLKRHGLCFLSIRRKVTGQSQTLSATRPDNGSLPLPLPLPVPCADHQATATHTDKSPEVAERMYALHPKKTDRFKVLGALRMALNRSPERLPEVEACHAAWCETENWKKANGQYCPPLAQWLADQGFTKWPNGKEPPKPVPPRKEYKVIEYDPFGINAKARAKAGNENA